MSFDNVIVAVGGFGRYQRRIYLLLCIPPMFAAFHSMSGVFLAAQPSFRCLSPGENPENATFDLPPNISAAAFPWDNDTESWSKCEMYDLDIQDQTEDVRPSLSPTGAPVVKCDSFLYDKSIFKNTITSEFNLICNRAWLRALADSLLVVGMMAGAMVFGGLADRYGRKPIICLCAVIQLTGALLASVAPEIFSFMIFRSIVTSTENGLLVITVVSALEMLVSEKRLLAGIGIQIFYSFGYISVALFAYFIRDWRFLQAALAVPSFGLLTYWWLIPESARWLFSNGRREEAKEILLKASSENGIKSSHNHLDDILNEICTINKPSESEKTSVVQLFKYPNLRRKTILLSINWFVITSAYYGLSWNSGNLGGDLYLNFALVALVELPGHMLPYFTMDRWGRKIMLCGCMFLAGVVLLLAQFVPSHMIWPKVLLTMLGKFAITAAYDVIIIFAAEQYPTVLRNTGVGACATYATIGAILAPYVNYSSVVWNSLPFVIFGTAAIMAGVLALRLPETLNQILPDTIEDGERFGSPNYSEQCAHYKTRSDETKSLQENEKI
ncbi:organic cation transporter protein-like [Athalia rosae]|uniref:organic cation transporter protein-like n=1 Tax=Athalia rosae TaxID=37344 RepID=UPI002033E0BB|nr:organic cation transporter protein-like [Athalia rosae]